MMSQIGYRSQYAARGSRQSNKIFTTVIFGLKKLSHSRFSETINMMQLRHKNENIEGTGLNDGTS